ncbi:integrin-linked kinase-associated serine/threonine phosphatase 2C isoform X4 [Gouania willdenowi]|nr:integrin-linked kinase-associated serine/threonine phosphatase 2C isoform X4 [Gouania willdenowi]
MQDAHVLLPDFKSFLKAPPNHISRVSYFAVFDGHGGARASRFAAENLHIALSKKFPSVDTPPENMERLIRKSLMDAFRQTDEEFLRKASSLSVYRSTSADLSTDLRLCRKPTWKDGSTATCVLIVDDVVYVANLGDSRALLCRRETMGEGQQRMVTFSLSKEHNPTIYEERMRIQRAGGTVRDGRVLGVLEVSRSIGDGQYKRCGVISVPDIRRCRLSTNDRFVLLACDGLFKVFTADEAVDFVVCTLKQEQTEGAELGYEAACQQLASEAVRRGSADNVTVVLVPIGS